jgi:hypothetical protein
MQQPNYFGMEHQFGMPQQFNGQQHHQFGIPQNH